MTALDLPTCNFSPCKFIANSVATLLHHDFNKVKKIRNLELDLFLKTVLCFYFYCVLLFCALYVHLFLFVIHFVYLYIFTDVIIVLIFICILLQENSIAAHKPKNSFSN